MTDELSISKARVAELEIELAASTAALNHCLVTLDKLAKLGNGDQYGNSVGNTMALKSLRLILGNGYN